MYSEMRKFWFWAHKVLPLVYDDSLSYYEVLCKVVAKLNECIDKINELGNELDEFEGWTREEFQKVRDEMAAEILRVEGEISDLDSKVDREVGRLDTKIDGVESNLGSRITAVMANFCGGWIAGSSYNVGAIVRYGDTVWECITPNTDEEFDSSKWRATTIKAIMDDLATALRSEISGVVAMVAETRDMIAPEYSVTGTYYRTQYVRYAGRLYKARTDIPYPAGDWDSSEWMEAPLSDQILRNYNFAYHCYEALNIPIYSATTTYNSGDVVQYENSVYLCNEDNTTGVTPSAAPTVWAVIWNDVDTYYNTGVAKKLYDNKRIANEGYNKGEQAQNFISAREWTAGLNYSENEIVYTEGSTNGTRHYYIANEDITNSQDITQENFTTIDDINDLMGFVRYRALTQSDYDSLVSLGAVRSKTLYFIY